MVENNFEKKLYNRYDKYVHLLWQKRVTLKHLLRPYDVISGIWPLLAGHTGDRHTDRPYWTRLVNHSFVRPVAFCFSSELNSVKLTTRRLMASHWLSADVNRGCRNSSKDNCDTDGDAGHGKVDTVFDDLNTACHLIPRPGVFGKTSCRLDCVWCVSVLFQIGVVALLFGAIAAYT